MPALGYTVNRAIAEEFAISIFKIDPGHGHANFVQYWREALEALDEMPKPLPLTSRSFPASFRDLSTADLQGTGDFSRLGVAERVELLERAVADIRYALENIPATADGETDLNLYNSLAHAYQDLLEEEAARGAGTERIAEAESAGHTTRRFVRFAPTRTTHS